MRAVKWILGLAVLLIVGAFLHYVLPRHAVVYITSTENRIVSADEVRGFRAFSDGSTSTVQGRIVEDVFFINTTRPNGRVLVFRNEDTGFGFPWYLKFNSADVQARAQDAVSTQAAPRWMAVRYYGWRVPYLSMFPNAVSLWPVAGPDVRIVPWFSIVILILLAAVVWAVWSRLRRWRRRRLDPALASWETESDRRQAAFWRWFGRR
jgi:hypothetical protein